LVFKNNGKLMERMHGEFEPMSSVVLAARLPFGIGKVGERYPLVNDAEIQEFAEQLGSYIRPLTITNTADCVDDRPTIALGDGTNDPETLESRITYQLAGGLGLALTKAAVGADAAYLRDSKNFQEAYLTTVEQMTRYGFTESGHKDCGASKAVEKSVVNELNEADLLATVPALTHADDYTAYYIERNWQTKRQKLEDGFYGAWSNTWHEGFLSDKFAQNFSILAENPNDEDTHGHDASGVLVIQTDGMGFAKNMFTRETGRMAFADTPSMIPKLAELIKALGGSEEERGRISVELGVDPAQVLNGLVVKDFPAFVKAA